MTDLKPIVAGPFLGELGWELFCWQGWLRRESTRRPVYVACRGGHEFLYEDFAAGGGPNNRLPWDGSDRFKNDSVQIIPPNHRLVFYSPVKPLAPAFKRQNWFEYQIGEPSGGLVIHARQRRDLRAEDNWPHWSALAEWLAKQGRDVTWIGAREAAWAHPEIGVDARGATLRETAGLVRGATVIGTSSGPMHLAALSGAKQLVIITPAKNHRRYLRDWNPFKVPVTFSDHQCGWRPPADSMITTIEGVLYEA